MRVAIVYDRVNKWGGAERILMALHELFPEAPLYTSVYNPRSATWARIFDVRSSFLQHIPFARGSHEYFALAMPIAFENFDFSEYDLVISVTSEAAKGIITHPGTRHICYCLTPTRYLWSGYHEYFSNSFFRFLATPAIEYLRRWDKIALSRPDTILAISHEVQERVRKYYHKKVDIVYPPLSLEGVHTGSTKRGDYFLIVSRLVPYKKVDLAIKACNALSLPLKIIGSGSELSALKRIAGSTIQFLGNLTDQELVEYYKGCKALLFPGKEDFGLTILEAQKYGKPVIAYRGGGALETILDGKTGLFFYPLTIKALVKTMRRFEKKRFDPRSCRRQAALFSKERFKEEFIRHVEEEVGKDL